MLTDVEYTNEWIEMANRFINETEDGREPWFRGTLTKIRAAAELAQELDGDNVLWALLQRSVMRGLSVKYSIANDGWDAVMELTRCMVAEQGDATATRLYELAGERIKWPYEEDPVIFRARPENRIYEYGTDAMRAFCSIHVTAIRRQVKEALGRPVAEEETYAVAIGAAMLRMKGLLDVLCSLAPPSVGHRLCVEAFARKEEVKMMLNEGRENLWEYTDRIACASRMLLFICQEACFPGVNRADGGTCTTEGEEGE